MGFLEAYLKSPESLGLCRLPSRASFVNKCGAVRTILDGEWKFQGFYAPGEVPEEALAPGFDDSSWRMMGVPSSWMMIEGFDAPHYTNVTMPFAGTPPCSPEHNPTGVYRRTFELKSRAAVETLCFDGVEGCFAVWVNGNFAGASKEGRSTVEFDVGKFLKEGENLIAVAVSKFSEASFVEDQDHWYMPGITRRVSLLSEGQARIFDLFAKTTLADDYTTGILDFEAFVAMPKETSGFALKGVIKDGRDVVAEFLPEFENVQGMYGNKADSSRRWALAHIEVPEVKRWTSETPDLYTLEVALEIDGEVVSAVSTRIGFRRYELKDGLFRVNNVPVRIDGVNRHDHHERFGKHVPLDVLESELKLMKAFNVNAVRTSHYPNAVEFYDLCDELGLYVMAEANLEHHAYYNDLCRNPLYTPAFADRAVRCFERDKNHACIFSWSLGNEAGAGANHAAMAGFFRYRDSSRLIHYEGAARWLDRDHNAYERFAWINNIPPRELTDFIAPMYPSHDKIERWAKENTAEYRPLVMCEYCHSRGNSTGSLREYYELFERYPRLQGGFLWEWIDHGILRKLPDGTEEWSYGGDFGDEPNDLNCCIDGVVSPDRTPHPGLYEFKYLAQPAKFTFDEPSRTLTVRNLYNFRNISGLDFRWRLERNGEIAASGTGTLDAAPGESVSTKLDFDIPEVPVGTCLALIVELCAENGGSVAYEGFTLHPRESFVPAASEGEVDFKNSGDGGVYQAGGYLLKVGADGAMAIDADEAQRLISAKINLWRAPTDSDGIKLMPGRKQGILPVWRLRGYDRMNVEIRKVETTPGGTAVSYFITAPGVSDAGVKVEEHISLRNDGAVLCDYTFDVPPEFTDLPRLGVALELPERFSSILYRGMGPIENYRDRDSAVYESVFCDNADDFAFPYILPQSGGNRTGVLYAALTADNGEGVLIVAPGKMEFSANTYSDAELYPARHRSELKKDGKVHLCCDLFQRGLGSSSTRAMTLDQYCVKPGFYNFRLILKPLRAGESAIRTAASILSYK